MCKFISKFKKFEKQKDSTQGLAAKSIEGGLSWGAGKLA